MKITGNEPDIIMITEMIPKFQTHPISPALLAVPGYSLHTNFDPSLSNLGSRGLRGVGIYVKMSLRATEAAFGTPTLIEQLWVQLSLSGNDKLLIGCLY